MWKLTLLFVLFTSLSYGVESIYLNHDDAEKVDKEFENIYQFKQDKSLTVVSSTPAYTDMADSSFLLYVSTINAQPFLVLRSGTSTYIFRPVLVK